MMSNYRPPGPANAASRSRDSRLPEGSYQDRGQYSADRRRWNTDAGESNRDQRRDDYRYPASRSTNDATSSLHAPISHRTKYNNNSIPTTERVPRYGANSLDQHNTNKTEIAVNDGYQRRPLQHGIDNERAGASRRTGTQGSIVQHGKRDATEPQDTRYVRFPSYIEGKGISS
jgi:hypothetical protein